MKEDSGFGIRQRVRLPYRSVKRRHYWAGRLAILFVLASTGIFFGLLSSCGQAMEKGASNGPAASAGTGHVFYVSMGGNDNNDGSSGHPWATIQNAANRVAAGDTVHVMPGTYSTAVKSVVSGTSSQRIRFISDTKWGAKIIAHSTYTAWENRGDYVDIAGFDITGDGNLGILNLGSFVRIVGNHVHDIPAKCTADGGAGIDHGNFAGHDNDTVGNIVHNIGDVSALCPRVHGIYHANQGGHVWNNIAFDNPGYGIHLWHAPANVVVANNLAFHNGDGGITVGAGDAPGGVTADDMIVTNNILLDNGILGAGWAIVESGRIGAHNQYSNNIIWGNRRGIALEHGRDFGTINADPRLVHYTNNGSGDYRLAGGSPAIAAGTQAGAPSIDFDGRSRQAGQAADIGPYAFSNAPAVWPF